MIAQGRTTRSEAARLSREIAPPTPSSGGEAPHVVARLVPLDPGFYAFSLAAETGGREPVGGFPLPAVHLCAPPRQDGGMEITDGFGRIGSWLGGRHRVLFVKSPTGGTALVTGYLARDPHRMSLALDIRRLAAPGAAPIAVKRAEREPAERATPTPLAPVMTLRMGGTVATERLPQRVGLDVLAHIRGRGDVHFVDTPWVGRLGPGLWIEGFAIFPDSRLAAAIEYKGLAASGTETPWIESGALCGIRGSGIPLIGFAVRQRSIPGGAAFDCEYTGYFQSGATAGPTRNGAPCRSAIDHDALEGMQLQITARPTRSA